MSHSEQIRLVWTADDLPKPVNGEHVLPQGGTVWILGQVNIGANAIRIPATNPCVLRGTGGDAIISSATGGVVRCDNPDAALLIRELSIVATAGPCLNLTGTIDHQLNVFFVGMFGVSAGTVSGFNVQAFKDCFVNAADGLTLGGTTAKVFISQCPFYGIGAGGSGLTFAADLNANVVDIVTSFFKYDGPGVCITAEAGYTVGGGILRGTLIDGTATPLVGLSPADLNWQMNDNDGIRDSLIAGLAYAPATTPVAIATIGTFVQIAPTLTLDPVSERFVLDGDELLYVGRYPALIDFAGAFALDPAGSDMVAVRATLNGTPVASSETVIQQGVGAGASSRAGSAVCLHRIVNGDRLGIALANMTSTDTVNVLRCTLTARG